MRIPINIKYPLPSGRLMTEFMEIDIPDGAIVRSLDIQLNNNSKFDRAIDIQDNWGGSMAENGYIPMSISWTMEDIDAAE